jgi:hypothetical protein
MTRLASSPQAQSISCYKLRINFAAKGFHQYITRTLVLTRYSRTPSLHFDAGRTLRRHPAQRLRVINPKPHDLAALRQLGGQAPAHTYITKVVDNPAKNIPT